MNYRDTLDYLFSQLPMYQRTGEAAYKKDIGNIIEACTILDNPHKKFKSIHIRFKKQSWWITISSN